MLRKILQICIVTFFVSYIIPYFWETKRIKLFTVFCIAKSLITFWRAGVGAQTNQTKPLRTTDESCGCFASVEISLSDSAVAAAKSCAEFVDI